jgi:MtN3 and saliva related transmembrane protein
MTLFQNHAEMIGFAAAILTTTAFAPQVIAARRTGARDVSWAMLTLFGAGVWLWLIYGLLLKSWPMIAANSLTDLEVLLIGLWKWRHQRAASDDPASAADHLITRRISLGSD